jgi:hypothetical protein
MRRTLAMGRIVCWSQEPDPCRGIFAAVIGARWRSVAESGAPERSRSLLTKLPGAPGPVAGFVQMTLTPCSQRARDM